MPDMPYNPSYDSSDRAVGLDTVYQVRGAAEAAAFYDIWADNYDDEVEANGYITPRRCAEALARFATNPSEPIMDLACGTGLSGRALAEAGFGCIDGFDISEGMLDQARLRRVYRALALADLSKPLQMSDRCYANAAAIGCISPEYMPTTVLDQVLGKLCPGGCLVFSVNDHAAEDGTIRGRINELVDCGWAELLFAEYGEHLPEIELKATVYVMRRR